MGLTGFFQMLLVPILWPHVMTVLFAEIENKSLECFLSITPLSLLSPKLRYKNRKISKGSQEEMEGKQCIRGTY